MRDADLDLVLFGATGFTGRLVAEYLARKRVAIRWALAGRDRAKLTALRDDLRALDEAAREVSVIECDLRDRGSVDAVVRRTRVVCTAAGPYARVGLPLVAACAERGVHYCDITGEPPFIRAAIDASHERAVETGARIVHCCGFDSIPSDLGVFLLHQHLASQGRTLERAHYRVVKLRGRVSPGTLATMVDLFARSMDPGLGELLRDPYALCPRGGPRGPETRDQLGPRYDTDTGRWTAPFVMAPINTRIVRRSNALLGHAYGLRFQYDEALDMGEGSAGLLRAAALSTALASLYTASMVSSARALMERVLPVLGVDADARGDGFFRVEIRTASDDGGASRAVVEADGDPGYDETAKMLGESALCLAQDALTSDGGVLTPAVAMGGALIERLRAAGIRMRVEQRG